VSEPKVPKGPSFLNDAMSDAVSRRRVVVHAKYSAAEAAEARVAAAAAEAATAASQAGIGGGPAVATPPGESFGDAVRRQALGG